MARYTYTLRQEIGHQGLNKYRVVTAQNRYELNQKIAAIQAQWDEQWRRKCEVEARKRELEARKRDKEQQKRDIEKAVKFAEDMTKDAIDSLEQIENILKIQIKPLEACDMYPESVKLIVFICQSTIRLAKSKKCTLIMLNQSA